MCVSIGIDTFRSDNITLLNWNVSPLPLAVLQVLARTGDSLSTFVFMNAPRVLSELTLTTSFADHLWR